MSLEDKAKGYYPMGKQNPRELRTAHGIIKRHRLAFKKGYKAAIAEMMEKARDWTYAEEMEVATLQGTIKKSRIGENAITLLDELEKIAEDLQK